jgi:hypothetical protein
MKFAILGVAALCLAVIAIAAPSPPVENGQAPRLSNHTGTDGRLALLRDRTGLTQQQTPLSTMSSLPWGGIPRCRGREARRRRSGPVVTLASP